MGTRVLVKLCRILTGVWKSLPERKLPAEINVLLYILWSRFQISFAFIAFRAFLWYWMLLEMATSSVWVSRLEVTTPSPIEAALFRGEHVWRVHLRAPVKMPMALQIIHINFYRKCLCKVRDIGLHFSIFPGLAAFSLFTGHKNI